jgi:cation transport protein ChaC
VQEDDVPTPGLTRELLMSGGLAERIAKLYPDFRMTSDEERAASLAAILRDRPEHGSGVWLFAYGSLIWNPCVEISERRLARALGWHRAFCLSVRMGRGTSQAPGLMLGLRPGGESVGAVLRIAEEHVQHELDLVWRREIIGDGYIPRWVEVEDIGGASLGHAIAFTVNPGGPAYVDLPEDEVVQRLATAEGRLGTARDYLFRTRDGLRAMGINDPFVESLSERVTEKLQAQG